MHQVKMTELMTSSKMSALKRFRNSPRPEVTWPSCSVSNEFIHWLHTGGASKWTCCDIWFSTDEQKGAESQRILAELEHVDDECDKKSINFVKIDDDNLVKEFGIEQLPSLVYFERNVPSLYDGDLSDEEDVLKWLVHNVESDEIEDVTDEMLDSLIRRVPHLAVLFCESNFKYLNYSNDLVSL